MFSLFCESSDKCFTFPPRIKQVRTVKAAKRPKRTLRSRQLLKTIAFTYALVNMRSLVLALNDRAISAVDSQTKAVRYSTVHT